MQTPRKEDAEFRYLETCPSCGASNGMNATECWQCEATLRAAPDAESAPAETPAHSGDGAPGESAQPSFFPVFREAQSELAANDAANTYSSYLFGMLPTETASAQLRASRRSANARRWAIGASLIAAAAGLAWFMPAPAPQVPSATVVPLEKGLAGSPGPADARVTPSTTGRDEHWDTTAPTSETRSLQLPTRSTLGTAPPAKAMTAPPDAAVPPSSRVDSEFPPPPPVRAPCTPQVAALGLCTPEPG